MKKMIFLLSAALFVGCSATNLHDSNGNIVAVATDKKIDGRIVAERPAVVYGYKTTDAELEAAASSHFNSKFTLEKKEVIYKGVEEGNVFLLLGVLENGDFVTMELPARVTRRGIVLR